MKNLLIAAIALCGAGVVPAAAQEATHGCACILNKTNQVDVDTTSGSVGTT